MNISEYRSNPALSYSSLKAYLRSALHGLTQEPPTESAAMRFGTAVDMGMKNQLDDIIMNPHEDGRTKQAKEFKAANEGKTILTASEYQRVLDCIAALKSHPAVKSLQLNLLEPDRALFGSIDGIPLKGLPDWSFGSTLIDLKTTSSAISAEDFARTIDAYHYDLQAAVYCSLAILNGEVNPAFYWIVVESDRPFDVAVYKASDRILEVGRAKLNHALHNVKLAQHGGHLGISDSITEISMPSWYGRRFEDLSEK